MLDLPLPIIEYIKDHVLIVRSPAYLLVKNGVLAHKGGNLTAYGISVEIGEQIAKLLFLVGLLPLDEAHPIIFLPWITTENGMTADVHIFTDVGGDWILLLDTTLAASNRRLIQQKANELSLKKSKK